LQAKAVRLSSKVCSHKQLTILLVLITGVAEGGLGAEAAMSIASASPRLIVLSARSNSRASPIADKISKAYPDVEVDILDMDLGSFASIRNGARELSVILDVLICHAGIMAVPYGKTEDGFEKQFGVNHLGHFLFTNLLLKEGKIRNGGRIVIVTSDGHRLSDVLWEDPGFQVMPSFEPRYLARIIINRHLGWQNLQPVGGIRAIQDSKQPHSPRTCKKTEVKKYPILQPSSWRYVQIRL
jgi:hypothetical protein